MMNQRQDISLKVQGRRIPKRVNVTVQLDMGTADIESRNGYPLYIPQ